MEGALRNINIISQEFLIMSIITVLNNVIFVLAIYYAAVCKVAILLQSINLTIYQNKTVLDSKLSDRQRA